MGRLALAICVACLASGSAANTQDDSSARLLAREIHTEPTSQPTVVEAMNERMTQAAVHVALASDPQTSRQDLLRLLLLCAALKQDETASRH